MSEKKQKKADKTNPVGRPSAYDADYMIPRMLELAKDGKTVIEMCADFEISKDSFYEYIKKHKEFSDAYKRARPLIEKWWIDQGKLLMFMPSKEVNSTLFIWLTKNTVGWRDKIEMSDTDDEDTLDFT